MTHVLVARQDNAGDVLLAGPAVRAVAAGADRVTPLRSPAGRAGAHRPPGGHAGREAARLRRGVDEVLGQPAEWIDADPGPVDRARIDGRVEQIARLGV